MDQGELMINKNKKVCTTLDYTERFLTLFFSSTVQIYIIVFTSLVDISTGIMNSTKGLNICSIIARVKQYKPIIKKKNGKYDKTEMLAKTS